jgi:putative tricarboxylic transport membrane protein
MRLNDAVLGLLLLIGAAALAYTAQSFPAVRGQQYGADVFPTIVAAGFALCGIALLASGLRARRPVLEWADWARERHGVRNVLIVIGCVVFYILFSRQLGFLLTMAPLLVILLRLFGVGWIVSFVVAVSVSLAILYGFGRLLMVPLPWGVLAPYRWW